MALFKTSLEARNTLEVLRRTTGLRPNLWARAALCYSLSLSSLPETADVDSNGQEFPREVFFGKDEPTLLALVRQRHGRHFEDEAELSRAIKLHVERGIHFFTDEFERMNHRGDEFVLSLLRLTAKAGTGARREVAAPIPTVGGNFEARVNVGRDPKTEEIVSYSLNAPGQSPHIAVMGRNGSGKTRTGLSLLTSLASSGPLRPTCLVFDYAKGDIASNNDFVRQMDAAVIRVPDQLIPLCPLLLSSDDDQTVKLTARRFVDTVQAVVRLGPKQSDACLRIVKETFARALGGELSPATGLEDILTEEDLKGVRDYYRTSRRAGVNLCDVLAVAEEMYDSSGTKPDSLLAALRDFCEFPLFVPVDSRSQVNLLERSHVIDLSHIPEGLRKLAVFLTLDSLYAKIMNEADAPLDDRGFRRAKLIIVIDEAHNYLQCRQSTLEKLVRESRSKGVSIILLSQSPDDFDQPKYNFAREMGLGIIFSCIVERPRMIEALLGGDIDPQKLSQLPPGIAVTRIPGTPRPTEVRIWKP
jgi:DNA sulfur modification protein DndE